MPGSRRYIGGCPPGICAAPRGVLGRGTGHWWPLPRRQPRQKSLNRVGLNSVYRTVCWIGLCPNQSWMDRVSWPSVCSPGLLDLHEAPYPFAMAGPIVNHFHCVWIDERFQNALRRLRADHVFVRRASIVQDLGRSGGDLFWVRLDQERLCIGPISPMRI